MEYIFHDVGDANCIQMRDLTGAELIVDYGFSHEKKPTILDDKIKRHLLISHYHADHYRALFDLPPDSVNIDEVYYPYMAEFSGKVSLQKQLLFLTYFVSLGSKTGNPVCDLITLLTIISIDKRCKCTALKQGDTVKVGNKTYDVIWPPETIDTKGKSALSKAVKKIASIIEEDPDLKEKWDDFFNQIETCLRRNEWLDTSEGINEKMFNEYISALYEGKSDDIVCEVKRGQINESLKASIEKLSKKLHDVTNRFSICLYDRDKFLFLGDLEAQEINTCITYLKGKYQINHVTTLAAPHHGTHWGKELNNIYAKQIICSNGKQRISGFDERFKHISERCLHTFLHGTIRFDDEYPRYIAVRLEQ
jgi:beta-lactamase superfamily II metal-dependent hydrolase